MLTSIGIDPSLTGTGIVILKDGKLFKSKTLKNRPDLATVERVRQIVTDIVATTYLNGQSNQNDDAVIVSIEGFSYGSKGKSIFEIGYLGWRIREELLDMQKELKLTSPYLDVPPSSLKKFATGSGNAGKELILQQVYKRWGVELNDNNQADAYVLAQIGIAYHVPSDDLTAFQKEAIKALKKGG